MKESTNMLASPTGLQLIVATRATVLPVRLDDSAYGRFNGHSTYLLSAVFAWEQPS